MRLLFVVCEEAAQVVLALVLLHQLAHLLVLRVLLEEGVRARDSTLQVVQLGDKKQWFASEDSGLLTFFRYLQQGRF